MNAVDVLILGGGPAGLATAITLAQMGRSALILGRVDQRSDKIGESLAPAAVPVLQELGIWELFCAGGHRPCYGNQSSWGSPNLTFYDFIHDPNGHAWHINRRLFEEQLRTQAALYGVAYPSTRTIETAQWVDPVWQLGFGDHSLTARFVVDATGRTGWFARRQKVMRQREDQQVALVAFLQSTDATLIDSTSLIESTPMGWWYSALLPDERLVTAFMTDLDLHNRRQLTTPQGWQALLAQSRYTAARVHEHGYAVVEQPYWVAASGGRLPRFGGKGWLAVGDAAMSYDPLAAHGLTLALASGRDAALAIDGYLDNDPTALQEFGELLEGAHRRYLAQRQAYYQAEQRWLDLPYWQRRHTGVPAKLFSKT